MDILARNRSTLSLVTHTFAHFCVDFACFYLLFAGLANRSAALEPVAIGFLAYNVIAFGLQPLIGYLCDQRENIPIALLGCLMLIIGMLLPVPWPALAVCALGNACFHVGGGIDSLVNADGKVSRSGIFVSSGALGVALGTLSGKSGWPGLWLPIILIGLSSAAIVLICPFPSRQITESGNVFQTADLLRPFEVLLLLCALSILVRSYVGSIVPISWRTTALLALVPAFAAGCGKAAGGFLSDWLGARRTGVISLLASLPFLVFGYSSPLLCATGILFFNISMPITLCALFSRLPANPGLAFGLTTLSLLVGNIPTYFLVWQINAVPYPMSALILISAGCLYLAVTNQKQGGLNYGKNH